MKKAAPVILSHLVGGTKLIEVKDEPTYEVGSLGRIII